VCVCVCVRACACMCIYTYIYTDVYERDPNTSKKTQQRNLYTSKETYLSTNTRQYNVHKHIQRDLQNRPHKKKSPPKKPICTKRDLSGNKYPTVQHAYTYLKRPTKQTHEQINPTKDNYVHQKRPILQQIPDSTCLHIFKETYKTDPKTKKISTEETYIRQKRPVWQQIPDSTTCRHVSKETYRTDPRTKKKTYKRDLYTSKPI